VKPFSRTIRKDGLNPVHPRGTFPAVEAKAKSLSFEDALTQLEQIVESMEAGDVPLAELLAKFEDGNKLLKVCETRLKDAELKIEQLRKQKDGVTFEKVTPGA
jgi:exodeoxyribonuclease VII small subunit